MWEKMDYNLFRSECAACGLPVPDRMRNGEPIFDEALTPDQQTLLEKIGTAHGKPLTDTAVLDLRDHLGADSAEWAAYEEIARGKVRKVRAGRYAAETDHLLFDWLADCDPAKVATALGADQAKVRAWQRRRAKIQQDLPY